MHDGIGHSFSNVSFSKLTLSRGTTRIVVSVASHTTFSSFSASERSTPGASVHVVFPGFCGVVVSSGSF